VVTFSELTRAAAATCGVRAYKLCSLHAHTVNQIMFVPELDAFISCSSIDSDTSVYIGDIYRRKVTRMSLTKVSCMYPPPPVDLWRPCPLSMPFKFTGNFLMK